MIPNNEKLGPVQNSDIKVLQAIILATQPKTIVEFGTQNAISTQAMLEVIPEDAHLYSFDPYKQHNLIHPQFTFLQKSQTEVDTQNIDLVFFDGSHEIKSNIEAFNLLNLSENAIIAIHDTGLWKEMYENNGGIMTPDGYAHQPHEREFVNWIKENHQEYQIINLHTQRAFRHGITLIQKYKKL
jgi:predicted O-methyltransferase YrrM